MKALVLIDIQNDFLPGGALPVPAGDRVIPVANALMGKFDLIVATQDWHPAGHGSFAASHPGRKVGEVIELDGLTQILWPVHCVRGTPGAAFAAALDDKRVEAIFRKGTSPRIDSYSGFFDNAHRKDTGLGAYLKGRGVTDVYLAGLATDYCVKFSALDARRLGFNVRLIEDGCRGVELAAGDVKHAIAEMRQAGVDVVRSGGVT
jgi:nicotinamidase/pyrazinamidase